MKEIIMEGHNTYSAGKCPVMHGGATTAAKTNQEWWPKALIDPKRMNLIHAAYRTGPCWK
jgi:catalase (peroxidase I)